MKFLSIYILSLVLFYPSLNSVLCHLNVGNKCSQSCLACENGQCLKCERGLYSFENQCLETCPLSSVADNISFKCLNKSQNPLYAKAFTVSRCMNSCGKVFADCSCHISCEKRGNCCTDYKICEIIASNHSTSCLIDNCKLCTKDRKTCLQCKDNFNYFNGNCVIGCPNGTVKSTQNICLKREESCDQHCEKCEEGKCLNCHIGFFLFDGKCLRNCPVGYRANRVNFTCLHSQDFSFYWIYPSRQSCDQRCGDNSASDCSCKYTCLRRGNCCDNFEKLCPEEITKEKCSELCEDCTFGICKKCKENSKFNNKNQCECIKNYHYDQEEDICFSASEEKKEDYSDSIVFLSKKDKKINHKDKNLKKPLRVNFKPNKEVEVKFTDSGKQNLETKRMLPNYDQVSNSLRSHLKETMDRILQLINNNGSSKNNVSVYLNGNINLNMMNNNVKSNLLNKRLITTNSNNQNNHKTENVNSFNSLHSVKKQGNSSKHINSGNIELGNQLNASFKPSRKRIEIKKNNKIDHEKTFGQEANSLLNQKENFAKLDLERNKYVNPQPSVPNYILNPDINRPIQHYHEEVQKVSNYTNIDNSTNSTIPIVNITIFPNQTAPSNNATVEPVKNEILINNSTGNHTNSLIIGHENEVKGNRLFHNVINVHNSYIVSAKHLESLKNLTLHNSTNHPNHLDKQHNTLIIVNANK